VGSGLQAQRRRMRQAEQRTTEASHPPSQQLPAEESPRSTDEESSRTPIPKAKLEVRQSRRRSEVGEMHNVEVEGGNDGIALELIG